MFVIFGWLNFIPGKYDEWQDAYTDLEKYVEPNEPSTLSYYFGVPEEYGADLSASPQMIAFEAYNVREDLYTTHFSSKSMGAFLPKIAKTMTTGLDLTHFEDVGGFLDKPGNKKECGIFTVTKFLAEKGKREEAIKKLVELAKHVEQNEKDTYTYLVLKSFDNETDIRIFERYASRKAFEAHMASTEVIDCLMGSKEEISSMESRSFIPNGRGWLHR